MKLQEMPRPSKVVDFPRKNLDGQATGQIRIWVLKQEERMASIFEAERLTKHYLKDGKKDDLGYEDLYQDAVCVEVLTRACRNVDDPKRPAFPSSKQLRQELTTDELATLFQHYLTVQLELGPIVASMSEAEMTAWVERLQEGGSAFPFDLLSSELQRILLLFMARRLSISSTVTSSAGSQPEEQPSDEPPVSETPLEPIEGIAPDPDDTTE